ncbi:MAG: hypothetical protein AB7D51_15270 [Desulfovibrionaceae bacterium]
MRDDVRAYGDIHGLGPEAFEKIKDSIPFPQVEYDATARTLHVDHEGKFIWIEDFLDQVCAMLDEDGWGEVDFLDHTELVLTRHSLKPGQRTSQERPFDQIGTAEMRQM